MTILTDSEFEVWTPHYISAINKCDIMNAFGIK